MDSNIHSSSLNSIKAIIWKEITRKIQNNNIPFEGEYFLGLNDQMIKVSVQLSQDYVSPITLTLTIMIHNCPCQIKDIFGTVSVIFSIYNIEDDQIESDQIRIENFSNEFIDIDCQSIQDYIAENWNK